MNITCLKYELHHSFVNKNKYVRRDLAIEFEVLAEKLDRFVDHEKKEKSNEYLHKTTSKLSENVFYTKDSTYPSTKHLHNNKSIVILSRDKDLSIIILNKSDYQNKVQSMIDEGIKSGKYAPTICVFAVAKNLAGKLLDG